MLVELFLLISFKAHAKTLRCSHYIHSSKHGARSTILRWHEDVELNHGALLNELESKFSRNIEISSEVQGLLKRGKRDEAKGLLESYTGEKIGPSDSLDALSAQLGKQATARKVLINIKQDDYSDLKLNQIGRLAIDERGDRVISEGLEFVVLNKISKVNTIYYHDQSGNFLIPDSSPKILGELIEDMQFLGIKNDKFGDIRKISYKCIYPLIPPSAHELERQYLKLAEEFKLKAAQEREIADKDQTKIQINEQLPASGRPTGNGSNSSSK